MYHVQHRQLIVVGRSLELKADCSILEPGDPRAMCSTGPGSCGDEDKRVEAGRFTQARPAIEETCYSGMREKCRLQDISDDKEQMRGGVLC